MKHCGFLFYFGYATKIISGLFLQRQLSLSQPLITITERRGALIPSSLVVLKGCVSLLFHDVMTWMIVKTASMKKVVRNHKPLPLVPTVNYTLLSYLGFSYL